MNRREIIGVLAKKEGTKILSNEILLEMSISHPNALFWYNVDPVRARELIFEQFIFDSFIILTHFYFFFLSWTKST